MTIIIGRNVKCVWLAVDQPCQFGKSDGYRPSVGVGMNERQLGAGQCNYQSAHFENYYHYDFIISNIPTGPRVISHNCTMN